MKSSKDQFIEMREAEQGINMEWSAPKENKELLLILKTISTGLNEHLFLLNEMNKKANMETMDGYFDYQTISESNSALKELARQLNIKP